MFMVNFVTVLCVSMCAASDCDVEKDCVSCSRKTSWTGDRCRWCPLDNACHAYASLVNSCRADQNIKVPEKCYAKTYGVYNPNSAFENTLLSAAAYSDDPQECFDAIYPDSGFRLVEAVARRCDDLSWFNYKECFAFTAVSVEKKIISVSFRGTTEFSQLINEFNSVLTTPKVSFIGGGKVQEYFLNAFTKLYTCTKQSILELLESYPDYDVVLSGHSLGGAIASITAASLVYENIVRAQKLSLYTFGMPRVGDKGYALQHDILINNSWRVVHHEDPVAHLPTCSLGYGCKIPDGPFHHKTEVYYPRGVMNVNSYYRVCERNEDDTCSSGGGIFTIDDHKYYFGIPVGTYCDQKTRKKRSAKTQSGHSRMWSLLSADKCKRIKIANLYKSATTTHSGESMSDAASMSNNENNHLIFSLCFIIAILEHDF